MAKPTPTSTQTNKSSIMKKKGIQHSDLKKPRLRPDSREGEEHFMWMIILKKVS